MSKTGVNIEGALAFKNLNKKKNEPELMQKDLADMLFTNGNENSRIVNMSNLNRGKTKRLSTDLVHTICKITGVDANFLFNIPPMDAKKLKEYGEASK